MQPDPNTAIIFDKIITQLENIKNSQDILTSIAEFAMGFPLENRQLDVCFGFNKVSPIMLENFNKDMVIGQGIYRIDGEDVQIFSPESIPIYNYFRYLSEGNHSEAVKYFSNLNESPIDIKSKIAEAFYGEPLQNVYLFGSLYFNHLLPEEEQMGVELIRGGLSDTGRPLVLIRDMDENLMVDLVKNNKISGTSSEGLELFKFIVSIDYFTGASQDSCLNKFKIITIDLRKSRGWAGFSEENLAVNLTPALIAYKNNIINSISSLNDVFSIEILVKNIIESWINLSWFGGFQNFWNDPSSNYILPSKLHDYIETNFPGFVLR
jgi:hypothetical protein